MSSSRVRLVLTALFYGTALVFLVLAFFAIDFSALARTRVDIGIVVAATVLALGVRYWGTFIWLTVLRGLGAVIPRSDLPELGWVYARAWMGRYIPGTAPWILGKIFFAAQRGVSRVKLAVGSLVEGGVQIVVLILLSAVFLAVDTRLQIIDLGQRVALAAVAVAGVVVLLPPIFNRLFGLALRVLRRSPLAEADRVDYRTIATSAGMYLVSSLAAGLATFGLAMAVAPRLGWPDLLYVIAATSVAGAAGMLAVFVPSGIGVREGVLIVALSVLVPVETALVVAIATRLWSILVDLLFLATSGAVAAVARRRLRDSRA